jgi:hypothetical protein
VALQIEEAIMEKSTLTYEMGVDQNRDNFYVVKREGVVIARILSVEEGKGKRSVWSVLIDNEIVVKKALWIDAWNWIKAREGHGGLAP